jgi:hypothetical protein
MNYFGISFNMVKFANISAFLNRENDGQFAFQLIDDSQQCRSSFLSEVNLFLEVAMINILSFKKRISRNPDILYTEILLVTKICWTSVNIPPSKIGAMIRKTPFDDLLNKEKIKAFYYIAFFWKYVSVDRYQSYQNFLLARYLLFEKIRILLDNSSHYAVIRDKYPNGLKTILDYMEACLTMPQTPNTFIAITLAHKFLIFYSANLIVKLLKWRMFVHEMNYIAASNILYAFTCYFCYL